MEVIVECAATRAKVLLLFLHWRNDVGRPPSRTSLREEQSDCAARLVTIAMTLAVKEQRILMLPPNMISGGLFWERYHANRLHRPDSEFFRPQIFDQAKLIDCREKDFCPSTAVNVTYRGKTAAALTIVDLLSVIGLSLLQLESCTDRQTAPASPSPCRAPPSSLARSTGSGRASMKSLNWILFFGTVLAWSQVAGKRYQPCSEGCCPHEYCAYSRICYPKIHCNFGCPDGSCENGLCMPQEPCYKKRCGMAHICSMNFNLGYSTCQYNLDIGSTLCVDREGKPVTSVP